MVSYLTSLDELTDNDVQEQLALLTSLLKDKYPNIDISRGVFHDLVLGVNAIYTAKTHKELERFRSANSLIGIKQDPDAADTDTVDKLLSNYNLSRKSGSYSTGTVVFDFTKDQSVLIPEGTQISYSGMVYQTVENVVAYSTSSDADYKLIPLSDGGYGCLVNVRATTLGAATFIAKNTTFTVVSSLPNINKVYAYAAFSAGADEESNANLVQRLADGLATPCWGNRYNIAALLKQREDLPELIDISVIGLGDEEMVRDRSILSISIGGKTDIYVKTSPTLATETQKVKATYLGPQGLKEKWQATLSNFSLKGAYRVTQVTKPNSSDDYSYEIVEQAITSLESDLSAVDAVYSAYQQITVTFLTDDIVSLERSLNDPADFDITVTGMPSIDRAQEVFKSRDLMPVSADALVKAATPAFVTVTLTLTKPSGDVADTIAEETITRLLTTNINNTGFCKSLRLLDFIDSVTGSLPEGQRLQSTRLDYELWAPTGQVYRGSDPSVLLLPKHLDAGVTENTCVFYAKDVVFRYVSK